MCIRFKSYLKIKSITIFTIFTTFVLITTYGCVSNTKEGSIKSASKKYKKIGLFQSDPKPTSDNKSLSSNNLKVPKYQKSYSDKTVKDFLALSKPSTESKNQSDTDIYQEHEKDFLASIQPKSNKNSTEPTKIKETLPKNSSTTSTINDIGGMKLTKKQKKCVSILDKYQPAYKLLTKHVTSASKTVSTFLSYGPSDCINRYQAVVNTIKKVLVENTSKVGILLPLSGQYSQAGKYTLEGIEAYWKDFASKRKFNYILKDTHGDINTTKKLISHLVLKENVSLLVIDERQKEQVSDLISELNIPVLLLNPSGSGIKLSSHIFYVYPSQSQLVETLTDKIVRSGYKRVAILKPNNSTGISFTNLLTQSLKNSGVVVQHDELYSSSNYETMEWASKSIFQIDPMKRSAEYADLMDKSRKKAQSEGVGFNPKTVTLPAIKDFDAVIIPDNFKIVRHFSNIFKYLGVNRIPLIGTYEWRSFDLIHPFDPSLEGSFFVDFIGKYTSLPRSLNFALEKDSPYFIEPSSVSRIDHSIIGYQSTSIIDQLLSKNFKKKSQLIKHLRVMKNESSSSYFKPGRIFDKNQVAYWPSFILKISNGDIQEEEVEQY